MDWLLHLLRNIFIGDPAVLPTLQAALKALQEGGQLEITDPDLTKRFRSSHEVEYEVAKQVRNTKLSVTYWRSRTPDGEIRESFDLLVVGKQGGIIVYFTDDKVVGWKRQNIPKEQMDTAENYSAQQLLMATREACRVS